ncbi:MAG: hypothetical protein KAR47_13170 [Planctomycetes bacterium]|nr:hypothetical protein [Planctomycetota bacterium]
MNDTHIKESKALEKLNLNIDQPDLRILMDYLHIHPFTSGEMFQVHAHSTFYNWRKKPAGKRSRTKKQAAKSPSAFIKVAIPGTDQAHLALELSSGNTLRICPGTNGKTLRCVLSILREEGSC